MEIIGSDCKKIINEYIKDLEYSDNHKKLMKDIINIKEKYISFEYREIKITKVQKKYFIQFLEHIDNSFYLTIQLYPELNHFILKKLFLEDYNINNIWNVKKIKKLTKKNIILEHIFLTDEILFYIRKNNLKNFINYNFL